MTAIQKEQIHKPEITENTINNNLTLPEMATFDEATPLPLSPLASLERCVSNPLVRGYSNASVSSDNEGNPHFVPWGRGHNDIANPNGSTSAIDFTQFGFSPNITGFNVNDPSFITNDDTVNCITPVASLLEKNRIPIPPQTILEPLEDQDTDFDARTDRTGTTSSQVGSSQDLPPPDIINVPAAAPGPGLNADAVGSSLKAEAIEFIPSFQPPPSLADTQMINIPPARNNNHNDNGQMMMPPLLQAVPHGAGPMMMPPLPMPMNMGLPPMNMNLNMNPAFNMPQPQRPQMNINVDMGPMMDTNNNTVQGSPQHLQQQQNTPNTAQQGRFRKNSGGSYDGIVRNYMDATGREREQNQSRSPDVNGSRSPINDAYDDGYNKQQPQQNKYRWGDIRNQPQDRRQHQGQQRGGGGQKYVVKTGQGQQGRQGQGGVGPNIANMEITDIIRMNVALPVLLENRMICKFMKHQNGSRYIQERLKNASHELTMKILRHIIFEEKQLLSLSKDIFGNYVIQIFFENGSKVQHQLLIENLLYNNVYDLSISFYGCRVIQKAFDCISQTESKKLILELEEEAQRQQDMRGNDGDDAKPRDTHNLIINPNANHVIQKIITLQLPIKHIQFIIDCIDANIGFYSGHIFGCRIVQNIINYYGYHDNKRMLKEMVSKDNLLHLCQSQYGNYVIQHILKLSFFDGKDKCLDIKQQVIKNVFGNVLYLSKNKYGSNVVEHCLEFANDKQKDYFLDQILNKKSKQILCEMVKHKYANYVIQKLLTYCNMKQKQRLIYHIERNVPNLRTLNYGKHIMDKIKKIKQQTGYNHNEQQQQHQQNQNQKKYYNNY